MPEKFEGKTSQLEVMNEQNKKDRIYCIDIWKKNIEVLEKFTDDQNVVIKMTQPLSEAKKTVILNVGGARRYAEKQRMKYEDDINLGIDYHFATQDPIWHLDNETNPNDAERMTFN